MSTILSADELQKMDEDNERKIKFESDIVSQGAILSMHNNHEFRAEDAFATVVACSGSLDSIILNCLLC